MPRPPLPNTASEFQPEDEALASALDEYLIEIERGTPPDTDEFLARYPHLQDRLKDCLTSLLALNIAGEKLTAGKTEQPYPKIEDYDIRREIGRGGMGVVYEANQISLSRRVALKVLPLAAVLDPKHLRRFKNEALAMAQMDHPHIVDVYAVGSDRGTHFYSMRFIEGQSLGEVIRDLQHAQRPAEGETRTHDSTLPPESVSSAKMLSSQSIESSDYFRSVARLGMQAADALHHAHEMGIIHRDVKPSNLLLDVRGDIWVSDFGLARMQRDQDLTRTGEVMGTLKYMSPEQATGKSHLVDHRSDIYSLGATLFTLLTLKSHLRTSDRQEVLAQLADDEPPALRSINPKIPVDLETIVMKAMQPCRDDRYTSAAMFSDDLQSFIAGDAIRAKRPNVLQRCSRFVRRNRVSIGWTCLLVSILAAASWMALHRTQQATAQLAEKDEQLEQYHRVQNLLQQADQDLTSERWRSAYDALTDAIELDSQLVLAYVNRSMIRTWAGAHSLAIQDCEKALDIEPNHPMMMILLSELYSASKPSLQNADRALELITRFKTLAPADIHAMFVEAFARYRNGEIEVARTMLDDVIHHKHRNSSVPVDYATYLGSISLRARYLMALCYHHLGQEQACRQYYDEANELYAAKPRYRGFDDCNIKRLRWELESALGVEHFTREEIDWNASDQVLIIEGERLAHRALAEEGQQWIRRKLSDEQEQTCSGDAKMLWTPATLGAQMDLIVDITVPGTYAVKAFFTRGPDYGIVHLVQGDQIQGPQFDGYAKKNSHNSSSHRLGTVSLLPGVNNITLEIAGKNPNSTNHFVGVDKIRLRRIGD